MGITINTLAQLSGLSKKTISRVINNEPNVRRETREKVLALIKQHNYRPNIYARNMNRKVNRNILVSVDLHPDFTNTGWIQELLNRLSMNAVTKRYRVLVETFFDGFNPADSAISDGGMVDCLVLLYERNGDDRIDYARKNGIPCIAFGKSINGIPYVANANCEAAAAVFRHLLGRGFSNISLVLGGRIGTNIDRAESAVRTIEAHGVPREHLRTIWDVNSIAQVIDLVSADIESNRLPDVYVISGDEKALGVYRAAQEHGLKIPEQISVVGFDDIPMSQYLNPPLTTVAQNFDELGFQLLKAVQRLMEDKESFIQVEVPMKLIVRGSVRQLRMCG